VSVLGLTLHTHVKAIGDINGRNDRSNPCASTGWVLQDPSQQAAFLLIKAGSVVCTSDTGRLRAHSIGKTRGLVDLLPIDTHLRLSRDQSSVEASSSKSMLTSSGQLKGHTAPSSAMNALAGLEHAAPAVGLKLPSPGLQ